jgi:hypothetical protein
LFQNTHRSFVQKRREFRLLFGKDMPQWRQKARLIMVPLLLDPNTGTVSSCDVSGKRVHDGCLAAIV